MRIVLTNFGTTGDFQPLLALAVELSRHGHQPVMAFSPRFAERTAQMGFEFVPVASEIEGVQEGVNEALFAGVDSGARMQEILAPLVAALPRAFEELCEASQDADVLIGGPAQPAARMVHEATGIPFVSVQFSHFGGLGAPALREASAALINPVRRELGLAPLRDPLTRDANSPQLALYTMSRQLLTPPADWPPHHRMTGFLFLEDEPWKPGEDLAAFMAEGDPPVVVSFGSMTHDDPEAMTRMLIEGIQASGQRAILQAGWSGLGQGDVPDGFHITGYAPHSWLFPRASALVHHGGAGTAGAVFRSGVPSVFVPHATLFDQTYWAQMAEERGIAGPTIAIEDFSAERLATSLETVLGDGAYRDRASVIGARIRSESGVRAARQEIEALVRRMQGTSAEAPTGRVPRSGRLDRRQSYRRRRLSRRREVG